MKKTQKTFIHLIDHDGTIYKLIKPLKKYKNHKILTSFLESPNKTREKLNKFIENQISL